MLNAVGILGDSGITGAAAPFIRAVSYGTGSGGLVTFAANGTSGGPTQSLAGDTLLFIGARGYGDTGFGGGSKASMTMFAAEDWTDTAQGTLIRFRTTAMGTTTASNRMAITDAGNVGIGTTSPSTLLEVAGTINAYGANGGQAIFTSSSNNSGATNSGGFFVRNSRGPSSARTATQTGDVVGVFGSRGYHDDGTPGFHSQAGAFMHLRAAENFTSTAQGTDISFNTSSIGTISQTQRMIISSEGRVGIGTGTPDTTLHVVGNIKMVSGAQGAGKVLASDAGGYAEWTTPTHQSVLGAPAVTLNPGGMGSGGTVNFSIGNTSTSMAMPVAGTMSKLYASIEGGTVSAGTHTFTVQKNGTDTALQVVVNNGDAGVKSDTTNSVSFAAGDLLSFQQVSTSGDMGGRNVSLSVLYA
jgi:hypothetical protein